MTTPQPPRNLHAPLRRVLPEKQSSGVQNVVIQQQQQHISSHPLLFNLKSNDTTTSVDSSYSSDHSTLSRETSDSSNTSSSSKEFFEKNFLEELSSVPPSSLSEEKEINDSLLEFAIRLGFDKQQLKIVLNKLNKNGQKEEDDKVLLELIKLGGRRKEEELIENNCNNYLKLLRPIVIDGSNIAMTHGNKAFFSCRGIRECVNYFTERGHTDILVFVPQFRREQSRSDSPIIDQHILNELEKEGKLIWTPSRRIGGRRIVCHDDRYILKTASEKQAVIVSNDEYRDLVKENPRWRSVVENYLLMYSFVDGKFMPPDDPLGRQGPNLDQLLTFGHSSINSQPCPYAKKCTYGNKCKYFHPERPNGVRIGAVDKLIGNNLNKKQYLTARPSLVAESVSSSSSPYLSPPPSHTNVGRTKSLNLTEMSKFNGEINLNPLSLQQNTSTTTKEINQNQNNFSHMFAPSTSIWGSCEFSLSPKTTTNLFNKEEINNNNLEKQRQHLQYHLSQLFPEATVFAVMAAHPQEMDAQILCQRIIAFQKGFQKEIEK